MSGSTSLDVETRCDATAALTVQACIKLLRCEAWATHKLVAAFVAPLPVKQCCLGSQEGDHDAPKGGDLQ